jgi:hypothetical protein
VFVKGRPAESNGAAVTSLVLGLLGILLLVPTAGVLSLPCSVAAWVTGVQARRRIASGITNVGEGMAKAGRILGIVGAVAAVIVIVVWVVLLATGFDFEQLQRDLERQSNPNAVEAVLGHR